MFKLLCKKDPKKEGVELADGSWDMDKFSKHVKKCEICRNFADGLVKDLRQKLEGKFPRDVRDN